MKKKLAFVFLFNIFFNYTYLIAGGLLVTPVPVVYPGGFNITCTGAQDGIINITLNGVPTYTVAVLKNGQFYNTYPNISNNNFALSSLGAGVYTITVTDQINNPVTPPDIMISEPHPLSVIADPHLFPPCNYFISAPGANNGKISAIVNGGTPGYSYSWSTGSTNAVIGPLPPGTYTVSVTDLSGCTASGSKTINDPIGMTLSLSLITKGGGYHVSCFNGRDGEVDLTVTNGCQPYEYSWDNLGYTSNQHPTDLSPGHHTVMVKDANGALAGASFDLTQPSPITADVIPFEQLNGYNIGCFQCFDGSINITNVTGGVPGYTYLWDPFGQTTQNISNLNAGSYVVAIMDANGCSYKPDPIELKQPSRDDWTINGNDNITVDNFIGTINPASFKIKTNSETRMTIDQDGNIGIGTSPSVPFDVLGDVKFQSLAGNGNAIVQADDDGLLSSVTLTSLGIGLWNSTATGDHIQNINTGNVGIGTTQDPTEKLDVDGGNILVRGENHFAANSDEASLFLGNTNYFIKSIKESGIKIGANPWTDRSLFLEENTGNVQIGNNLIIQGTDLYLGTTIGGPNKKAMVNEQATDKLILNYGGHFSNGVQIAGGVFKIDAISGAGTAFVKVDNTGTLSRFTFPGDISKVLLGDGSWGNAPSSASQDWQIDGNHMYTMVNGCVAIGTSDFNSGDDWPNQYKLAVNGHIICTEARVKSNSAWPDFVFDESYIPKPLKELESYIQLNKHLPGIPTSAEVEKEGINIGEMNARLLEKIEELTLYILDLKSENELLGKKVTEIEKVIKKN